LLTRQILKGSGDQSNALLVNLTEYSVASRVGWNKKGGNGKWTKKNMMPWKNFVDVVTRNGHMTCLCLKVSEAACGDGIVLVKTLVI